MEAVKELLLPEAFNKISFVGLILWIGVGITFLVLFGARKTNGIADFSCANLETKNKDYFKRDCYNQYEEEYNKTVSFVAFALSQLFFVYLVSLIYCHYVKSRIHELEESNGVSCRIIERSNRWKYRKLFCTYLCQLLLRFIFGIIFLGPQINFLTQYLPPSYACEHLNRADNATIRSTEKYNCSFQKDEMKTRIARILVGVNVFIVVFVAFELVWILVRAKMVKRFMVDAQFLALHLQSKDPLKIFIEMNKNRIKHYTRQLRLTFPFYVHEREGIHEQEIDRVDYPKLLCYPDKIDYKLISQETHKRFLRKSGTALENPEDMFVCNGENSNSILIVGSPGIGKTFLCEKLLRDWACGRKFNRESNSCEVHFDVAFLFSFRRFNSVDEVSLCELLSRAEHSEVLSEDSDGLEHAVISFILQNSSKILLIFDGIDEFSDKEILIDDNNYNAYHGNDEYTKMPFQVLYRKLASGKLLTGATVMTTVKSTTVSILKRLPFSKTVDILEFTPEKVKSFVSRFTREDLELTERIWTRISNNTMLSSLCGIPVNCLIVCYYLRQLLQLNCQSVPEKLTEVFTGILRMFIFDHNPEYRNRTLSSDEINSNTFTETVSDKLTQLGGIAYDGISQGNLVFDSQRVTGLERTGVLHRLPELPFDNVHNHSQYCFAHLVMQEFMSARYLVEQTPARIERFFSDHIVEGKWHQVIRFVAGLLDDTRVAIKILDKLLPIVPERKSFSSEDADAEDSELICWPSTRDKPVVLTLCKFMFECCNLSLVASQTSLQEVTCDVINLSECGLTSVDCAAIAHVSPHIGTCKISRIRLNNNHIGPLGCKEIGKLFLLNRDLTILEIDGNDITDHGVERLCSALSGSNSNLKKPGLGRNGITNEGVRHLCEVLTTRECKISQLNLSYNTITDTGVRSLLETLCNDECKLNYLNLTKIEITGEGIKNLSDALSTGMCKLSLLNLSQNDITDGHLENLSQFALSKKECKLNQFILSNNNITDVGVEHLSQALSKKECALNQLCLSFNQITDTGVRHLTCALSKDTCSLHSLNLAGNHEITHYGVKNLSDVLYKLAKLNLNGIRITDLGVKHLCDRIFKNRCKLILLDLGFSGITKRGVMDLNSALIGHNQDLELNLSGNRLTDSDVKQLFFPFSNKMNCKLNLSQNRLTDASVNYICKKLTENEKKISKLDLSNNELTDACIATVTTLSSRIRPHLELAGNNISDKNLYLLSRVSVQNDAPRGERCTLS